MCIGALSCFVLGYRSGGEGQFHKEPCSAPCTQGHIIQYCTVIQPSGRLTHTGERKYRSIASFLNHALFNN